MSNRMISLLERAARARRMIEARSQNAGLSDLQLLRLKRHSLLVRRHLEKYIEAAIPAGSAVAFARCHQGCNAQRS